MKNLKLFFCLLIVASLFTACKKKPIACFSIDKNSAAVNEPIVCDASCSKNAKKFLWLGSGFRTPGNESQSIDTVRYTTPGKYAIKLEVTNGKAKEDMISQMVTIY